MTRVEVNPGVCGFICTIEVEKVDKRRVTIAIASDCDMIYELGELLREADIWEIMKPHVHSAVHQTASQCQLHAACPVPSAVIKAVEVEAELALPRDVAIHFESTRKDSSRDKRGR
jgi:hypothetical protein